MRIEQEPPVGLTQEKIEKLATLRTIASSAHPFLIAPVLLIYYNDLVESLSQSEKQTSISER